MSSLFKVFRGLFLTSLLLSSSVAIGSIFSISFFSSALVTKLTSPISPATSNSKSGLFVLIPTLPEASILSLSVGTDRVTINNTGVGPLGLGGRTTALAVKVETHPCHIASLPVAINLNCHAARHKEVIL